MIIYTHMHIHESLGEVRLHTRILAHLHIWTVLYQLPDNPDCPEPRNRAESSQDVPVGSSREELRRARPGEGSAADMYTVILRTSLTIEGSAILPVSPRTGSVRWYESLVALARKADVRGQRPDVE